MLLRRYVKDKTQRKIGEIRGVSPRQASCVLRRITVRLHTQLVRLHTQLVELDGSSSRRAPRHHTPDVRNVSPACPLTFIFGLV